MKPDDRFTELALRYLDGRLTGAEAEELNARLREDAEARAWLWEIASQATEMGDIARTRAASQPNVVPLPKAARWSPAIFRWAAAAAMVALLATTLALWFHRETDRPILAVTDVSGEVTWSSAGRVRSGLATGDRLAAGTVAVESETGLVELRFADGTLVTLGGGSEAVLAAVPQKQIHLKKGTLFADVVAQPAGRPMLVRTATAEAQVLGTAFTLTAGAERTVLNVDRGHVRLQRRADGQSVDVGARQTVSVSLDTRKQLQAIAQPALATEWRLDVSAADGQQWKCEWRPADQENPARVAAVPYRANKDVTALKIHYGVILRSPGGYGSPLVALTPASVLRLRCRMETSARLEAFLSTRRPGGQFGGNFVVKVPMNKAVAEPGGWLRIEVPLDANHPIFPHLGTSLDQLQAFLLIVNSADRDAGLEIAELSIGRAGSSPRER